MVQISQSASPSPSLLLNYKVWIKLSYLWIFNVFMLAEEDSVVWVQAFAAPGNKKKFSWLTSGVIVEDLQYVLLIVCVGDNKRVSGRSRCWHLVPFLGVCGFFFFFFFFFCKVVLLQCERLQAAVWNLLNHVTSSAQSTSQTHRHLFWIILLFSGVLGIWTSGEIIVTSVKKKKKKKMSRIFHFTSKWSYKHISQLILLTY